MLEQEDCIAVLSGAPALGGLMNENTLRMDPPKTVAQRIVDLSALGTADVLDVARAALAVIGRRARLAALGERYEFNRVELAFHDIHKVLEANEICERLDAAEGV
jgi:hypothetical protein